MSISFGSPGTSANVNAAFLSRTVDTDTIGRVDLLNAVAESGASIFNIQRCLNSYAAFIGATTSLDFDETPTWGSNELGTAADTLKARIEAIDAEFADLRPYIIDATLSERGLVSTGAQTFGGDKTFGGNISAANLSGINSGDLTLANIGSSPSADGASLSGQELTLQPANGTFGGVLTAIAQTIAGLKTFAGGIVAQVSALFEGIISYDSEEDGASTGANATLATPTKTIVRLTNASLTSVDGLTAPLTNQIVTIVNDTGNTIEFNNATGTAANQIITGSGAEVEIQDGGAISLFYDLIDSRWRLSGGGGGGGAGGGLPTRQTFNGTSFVATDAARQVWVYDGLSAQTLASIDITDILDQAEIEITCISDSNTLTVEHFNTSEGFILNGDYEMGLYGKLVLRWDATLSRFIEVSRNGL